MGAVWLGSLPAVLRKAGLPVVEFPGWQTRSRSTGGYEEVRAIGIHHDAITAGVPSDNRCRAGWTSSWNTNRPVGAIRIHTDGVVTVGAAGATNTQGRGVALRTSKGPIPENWGNLFTLSIEASNNGVGEIWPKAMTDNYVTMVAALMLAYKLHPSDVFAHFDTAPGRKVDPAGPSQFTGGSNTMWDMGVFRERVRARSVELIDEGKAWGIDPPAKPAPWPPFDPARGLFSLYPLNRNKPTLRRGSSGGSVSYLQGVVAHKAGGKIGVDGSFGSQTEGRVKDVQRFFGLVVDGWVGPQTWGVIDFLAGT